MRDGGLANLHFHVLLFSLHQQFQMGHINESHDATLLHLEDERLDSHLQRLFLWSIQAGGHVDLVPLKKIRILYLVERDVDGQRLLLSFVFLLLKGELVNFPERVLLLGRFWLLVR